MAAFFDVSGTAAVNVLDSSHQVSPSPASPISVSISARGGGVLKRFITTSGSHGWIPEVQKLLNILLAVKTDVYAAQNMRRKSFFRILSNP